MMTRTVYIFSGILLLVSVAAAGAERKVIEKRDDLPRYTYRIEGKAAEFVRDEAALRDLGRQVERDLKADLETFVINDRTTVKEFYADLGTIAMLEGRYDEYLAYVRKRRELEEKEAARFTTGLVGEVIALGLKNRAADLPAFVRAELSGKASAMPYSVVESSLKASKGSAEILSDNLVLGSLESELQPMLDKSGGEISRDVATQLLGSAYTLRFFLAVKDAVRDGLAEVIDAHQVEKPDIWQARSFDLRPGQGSPVTLAVWDSGVDAGIFGKTDQLWVNSREIPGNDKDDDGNGFVDDVHGIAFSLHSDPEKSLLVSVGELHGTEADYRRYMKGLSDIQAAIDSPEATELKQFFGSMDQQKVKPFLESINLYSAYAHGTHVAGIAAKGNPQARILACRITFDHRMIPETPTVEQARKDGRAAAATVEYFRRNGVRAVNMSWGGSLAEIEDALEKNNAGGSPQERKVLAREIFSIYDRALRTAIESSPDILFITSAGNSDNDVRFDEFLPSSYEYPNIMSVGAVDQAGDETSFTSFGKVDVYASGFEVLSYVPGGERIKMSGTSMASPQVMNLAGKLLALHPDLTVAELRSLIRDGAEEKSAGERTVRLINPRRSLELLDSRRK